MSTRPEAALHSYRLIAPVEFTSSDVAGPAENEAMTAFDPIKKLDRALAQSATARLTEHLERVDWPLRTIRKELESIDRFKRYLEPAASAGRLDSRARAMKQLTEQPSARLLRQVETLSKRMDAFAGQPKYLLGQLETFEKLVSSRLSRALKQLDVLQAATEAQSSWGRYAEIAASLEELQGRAAVPPVFAQMVDRLDRAARSAEAAGVDETALGEVAPEQYKQAAETFEALVQLSETAPTTEEQFDRVIAAIEANRDTPLQRVMWSIVVVVLINLMFAVVNPFGDFYVKKQLEQVSSRQEAIKVVKQEARNTVDDVRLISDYRFVSVPTERPLVVRSMPGSKAPRIAELRFSQVVYVLETTKEKDFTLVEWRNEDGTSSVKGWVFSRYLKKFT